MLRKAKKYILHDNKSYTQIKKNIFSWIQPNPVDPVSIWPEPDLEKWPDRPEPDFRSHTGQVPVYIVNNHIVLYIIFWLINRSWE